MARALSLRLKVPRLGWVPTVRISSSHDSELLPIHQASGLKRFIKLHRQPIFNLSHGVPVVELWPSSVSTCCVVPLRGDWAIFCHAGSGRVGRVWSAKEKSLEILRHSRELNPGNREDRQYRRCICSSTELSWPGTPRGQTVSEIYLFFHWAIMTRATERTDSIWDIFVLPLSHHDRKEDENIWK